MDERTLNWQLSELQKLVETTFVKTAKEVKGSYVTGDYVTWLLNYIFTPACWSFTILKGPEVITLSDKTAYAQVVGRLEVTFVGGQQAHQDDVGIWPLVATGASKGGTLNNTSPERYETVSKAARTDCLKNAAYNLGTCFGPLSDTVLVNYLQREAARNRLPLLNESAEKSEADLFGIAQEREAISGVQRVPEWVENLREAIEKDKRAGDPVKVTFIHQMRDAAEAKITHDQFEAFLQVLFKRKDFRMEELTFGAVRQLKPFIDNPNFEAQVVSLLS